MGVCILGMEQVRLLERFAGDVVRKSWDEDLLPHHLLADGITSFVRVVFSLRLRSRGKMASLEGNLYRHWIYIWDIFAAFLRSKRAMGLMVML